MSNPARPVHDWSVPEREYRRHQQRRGRRHAFTELVPARSALVVVDLVPFFVGEPWFRTILVDGCASVSDRAHNATLRSVDRSYGDVRPVAELVPLLEAQAGSA